MPTSCCCSYPNPSASRDVPSNRVRRPAGVPDEVDGSLADDNREAADLAADILAVAHRVVVDQAGDLEDACLAAFGPAVVHPEVFRPVGVCQACRQDPQAFPGDHQGRVGCPAMGV